MGVAVSDITNRIDIREDVAEYSVGPMCEEQCYSLLLKKNYPDLLSCKIAGIGEVCALLLTKNSQLDQ